MSSTALPERLGKYQIRGVLGRGAMGTVFDGWDPGIDRRVAIKTVRLPDAQDEEAADGLARFKREAQAAGRLTHPNIVGVFDYGETDTLAFIVMEFVDGRSLKEVLAAGERMAPADAVRLIGDVLAGLAYSHGRGVVHRDIKPANIMLTAENQAKIADFGIARIESSSMTQAGTIMGTPAYMSPEQFMGQVVDGRTDIYSCGVVLFQLLAGERPFEGSMASIMHKAMTTTPLRPSELAVTSPPVLDAVVAKAMARRPEDRYATATDFADALRAPAPVPAPIDVPATDATIMAPAAIRPAAAPPVLALVPVATPAPRRNRMPLLAGLGVGTLVLAGVAAWLLLPGSKLEPPPASPPAAPPAAPLQQQAAITPAEPTPIPRTPTPQPVPPPAPAQTALTNATLTPPPTPTPTQTVTPPVPSPPEPAPASPQQTASVGMPLAMPPAAPVTPAPEPVVLPPLPALPPATVAAALANRLSALTCSALHAGVAPDGNVSITGLAGAGAPTEAVHHAVGAADLASVTFRVQSLDGPYCPVLDLIRTLPDTDAPGLALHQDGGPRPLLDNQVIAMHATMPGFAGFLHVAYVQHDQTVSPLVPGPGYPQQTYPAHASLALGNTQKDSPGWLVGPPFGTDMIVAVASTAPLFNKPLPESQPLPAYLSSLQAAIDALRRRGGTVSATAQPVETRPAP